MEKKLIVYDKKDLNKIFFNLNLTKDIIKIILDSMYYNYYNFINNNWDKLNEIDCIYYTKNTNHTKILENVIKRITFEKKRKIIYEILPFSITTNNLKIFNILKNSLINIKDSSIDYKNNYKKHKDENYKFYYFLKTNYNLSIKLNRKEFIKYFKKIKNWYISYYQRKSLMYSYY
jgi:hypothetical protein